MAEFKPEFKPEFKSDSQTESHTASESESKIESKIELKLAHVIAERYQVVALLGAGGMGAVYLVEDVSTKKKYALKTILASGASDRNLKRFEIETNATKLLNHPNLVQIHDFGFIAENQPYFVMDYCDGQDLAALIKSRGTLAVEEALEIFITVCNALAYAHSQGVVHRDLKPSNVMITDGAVKILDFGIAKVFRDETAFNTVTRTGEVFGSPYYMSPEQCHGKAIDLRSDVYSLGCMFFEALTGTPPFVGDTALSTMLRHQTEDIPSLKEATLGTNFPRDLETIISRMLAKDPADRYQTLLHATDDLKHVQRGEPIPVIVPEKEVKPLNKGLIAIFAGAIAIGLITFFLLQQQAALKTNRAFEVIDAKDTLVDLDKVELGSVVPRVIDVNDYYSVLNPANPKVRDFHFPARSFGDFGHGDDIHNYEPARGLQKNVPIPIGLHIRQDCTEIGRFRNDEVSNLTLRGYMVNEQTTDAIKDWQELKSLDMDDTNTSDASLANLKGMKKLVALSLNDTRVTGNALLELPLDQLRLLQINHIKNAKVVLPRLRANKSLIHLSLIGDNITDEDLKLISEFQTLQSISLLKCPVTDKGVEYLAKLPLLKTIWIEGKGLTPNILGLLKEKQLDKMVIQHCPWSRSEADEFRKKLKRGNKGMVLDLLLDVDKSKRDTPID